MMLAPHMAGGSPVTSCIMVHSRRESSRRCSSATPARNSATDPSVRRIAGPFLVAIPPSSHNRLTCPGLRPLIERRDRAPERLSQRGESVSVVGVLADELRLGQLG